MRHQFTVASSGTFSDNNSSTAASIRFHTATPPMSCDYSFDVGAARSGGSAGSASLIAEGRSTFSMARITSHLATNASIIERFGLAWVRIAEPPDRLPTVTVDGAGLLPPEFNNSLRPQ